ncbi:MAG: 5-(carboxyamino)imidazole ribonucleotide synthase [Cyanobacteria bacterium J06554_3]
MTSESLPIRRVGVVGGGQLAWMMAPGAKVLDIQLLVQTPSAADPASAIASDVFLGPVADAAITAELSAACDVVTFENEFIDLPALRQLEAAGTLFYPQLECLAPLLDKYDQRQYCDRIGLPSPPFVTLASEADNATLPSKVEQVGLPLALKTRRHGYDGQGTFILDSLAAVQSTWEGLGYQPVLLEAFVDFEKELAVMVARSQAGEVVVYPVVETEQVAQVCRRVIVPARVAESVAEEVRAIATRLVTELGVVGIFGIELFLTASGEVLINEIAPRTHNSGHYSLDACETSQFEQQLRAVSGRPLGSAAMTCAGAVMVNLLGTESAISDYAEQRAALSKLPNAQVYWYGKKECRPGRKMGHVTVLVDSPNDATTLDSLAKEVECLWY